MVKFFLYFLLFFLSSFSSFISAFNLMDIYKKGVIKLVEDPNFGRNVDWVEIFYKPNHCMTIGPDGKFYINSENNSILIFNKEGNLTGKFGQFGEGPLDFYSPGNFSILDNKYLVVNEYVERKRITLIDIEHIDTKHVIILRTSYTPWKVIALKNNKIAYISYKFEQISKWDQRKRFYVIVMDVISKEEKKVAYYDLNFKCRSGYGQIPIMSHDNYFWQIFIEKSKDGNLIVGSSDLPYIEILSPDGNKLKSFNIGFQPIKISRDQRDELIKKWSTQLRQRDSDGKYSVNMDYKNAISSAQLLGDHLPYYRNILVDYIGNILLVYNDGCFTWTEDCKTLFHVYTPDGNYIGPVRIDTGKFKFEISSRSQNIMFTESGIYGLFDLKDKDDVFLRLVRVK